MLSREPDLDPDEIDFLSAYSLLRNQSGSDPIRLSDIHAYCEMFGVKDMEAMTLVVVGADLIFQESALDYQKKEAKKLKSKARRKK